MAFELVLRFCGYGNVEIYQPDATLYWKLKPNQDCYTKIDHKPVHINAKGTRGADFQVPKPQGTFRILSLGDSRTFGWGMNNSETYSARLQQLLQQRCGNSPRIEVINAGVNAWSLPQMMVFFRDTALAWHPDVVLVAEANGWSQFSEKNSPEFVKQFMNRVRLKNFLRHFAIYHYVVEVKLQAYYGRYRTKFIPINPQTDKLFKEQQQKDPDALFRSAVEGICGLAVSNHVQPVVLYLPMLSDLALTNAASDWSVRSEAARKFDAPFVDLMPEVRPEGKSLYLEADPVHFNVRGNELIARKLVESIATLVVREHEQASHR